MIIDILKADEGFIYTNGEVYGALIYLGCNDTRDNWYQIPLSIYNDIQNKLMEEAE